MIFAEQQVKYFKELLQTVYEDLLIHKVFNIT